MDFHSKKLKEIIPPFSLGFLSLGIQVIFFRLIFEIFYGNELTIGLSLGVWLFGSAIGASLIANLLQKFRSWLFFSILAVPILLLLYFLIKAIPLILDLKTGIYPNIFQSSFILLVTILPAAIICGTLFPYVVQQIFTPVEKKISSSITKVYLWESSGAFFVGLLMSFLLFHLLSSLQILLICTSLFLLSILYGAKGLVHYNLFHYVTYTLLLIQFFLFLLSPQILKRISSVLYSPNVILLEKDTAYGNIKFMKLEEQETVLEQGKILFSTPDPFSAENQILLPLMSHPEPKNILIIGGNISEFIAYISQFPSIKNVIYLEENYSLIDIQKRIIKWHKYKINVQFVEKDVREFLTHTNFKFDIICLNKEEPINLSLNRYYTRNFYGLVKKCLNPGGIFYFSILSSENYLNPDLCKYINLLKNSLLSVFHQIFIVPGDENHFFAGDHSNLADLPNLWIQKIQEPYIHSQYINKIYLEYRLSEDRVSSFGKQLAKCRHNEIDNDYNIKGYLYHFTLWSAVSTGSLSKLFRSLRNFRVPILLFIYLLFIFVKLYLSKKPSKKLLYGLAMIGGVSITLEIIILLQYQIVFGTLYSGMAIIFGVYMLGLAIGTQLKTKNKMEYRHSKFLQHVYFYFILICGSIFIPVYFNEQIYTFSLVFILFKWMIIPIMIFVTGLITGWSFAYITQQYYASEGIRLPGTTYAADLSGAVLASLFASIFLIPNFGIPLSIVIVIVVLIIQII